MPTKTLKARVELDGEAEYKRAISELNRDNAVLTSEMRKLTAQYEGNTKSVDYLTKRGEVLSDQLATQQAKVRETREAYAKAQKALDELSGSSSKNAEAFEAAQAKLAEWQIKLNNAEAAQFKLEHAIDENNQAIADQENALDGENNKLVGLGDTVDTLAGKLGIHLPDQAKEALNGMASFSEGSIAKMTAVSVAVAAVIDVVKELHSVTLEAATEADDLLTQSSVYSITLRQAQQLKYAENLYDVSASSIESAFARITKASYDAYNGNVKAAEAFRKLGVRYRDETWSYFRDSEDIFLDIIDALSLMTDQTEADAIAMQLLGKSAQEFNPIIKDSKAAHDLWNEAVERGYVLSDEQIEKLGKVDDAYQRMTLTVDAAKNKLALEFAPASIDAMNAFAEIVEKGGQALADSGIVSGTAEILTSLTYMLTPIKELLQIIPGLTGDLRPLYEVLHGIAGFIALIADTANAAIGVLGAFSSEGRQRFNTALGLNAKYGMYSNMQRWNGTAARYEEWRSSAASGFAGKQYGYDSATGRYYDLKTGNYIFGYNAAGTENWRGGLTWVGEAGPELVDLPQGTRIYNNQESRMIGGDTFNFSINVKDLDDLQKLLRWAKMQKMTSRMAGKEPIYG